VVRSSSLAQMLLALSVVPMAAAVQAAPPPPGWFERHQAEACAAEPASRTAAVTVSEIPAAKAGVRTRIPALRFERALDLRYDPALGRALGAFVDGKLGLVLATDKGLWLRLTRPQDLRTGVRTTSVSPMVDAGQPAAQSGSIYGYTLIARADGSLVSYDLSFCGLAAKPLANGRVGGGGAVRTLAVLDPSLRGFVAGSHIIAGGDVGGRWGEASLELGTTSRPVSLVPRPESTHVAERPVALVGWDVAGGCDLARFVVVGRVVTATSDCSPDFAVHTVRVLGDVGFPVTRVAEGRAGASLASFSFPVTAASDGVVLSATAPGRVAIVLLAIQAATYRPEQRR